MSDQVGVIEKGTVIKAHDRGLVVDVEGVHVYVHARIRYTGCDCCGDTVELRASYNKSTEDRIERHGEPDPLGIND